MTPPPPPLLRKKEKSDAFLCEKKRGKNVSYFLLFF
jgi:hypothetical protein